MIGQRPQGGGEDANALLVMLHASQQFDCSEARAVFLQFSCPGVNFKSAFKCQTECVEASVGGQSFSRSCQGLQ